MDKSSNGKQWRVASYLVTVALAGTGCDNGTDPSRRPVEYQFALAAVGGDTTAERARTYDCTMYGYFRIRNR